MLPRHKIPTIFNIYMLDVICCALGCVILLWQVAHKEAESQTEQAKKRAVEAELARSDYERSDTRLQTLLKDVSDLRAALADASQKRDSLAQSLASAEKERDTARKVAADRQDSLNKTARALDISSETLKKLEADLAKWVAAHEKITKDLAGKEKISTELLAKLVVANSQIDLLKKEKDARLIDLTAAEKRTKEQTELLRISQADASKLQKLLDSLRDESKSAQAKLKVTELTLKVREEDLDRTRKELAVLLTTRDSLQKELLATSKDRTDAKGQMSTLLLERDRLKDQLYASSKQLADANLALGTLRLDKDKLSKRVAVLEADLDQRFAGIPLTGENVIFLIDVSGSMVMKDPDIADPDKWPFLCDTLSKLMKSIPTLQRFQIILFSDKTTHLFGNRDHWLKYEGPSSAKQARDALLQVKVEGGTNMHDAFEEAFRYRKIKLDTIYLFSDGLPNIGPGVPNSLIKPSETQKNLHMAKFLRDKLRSDWNAPDLKMPQVRLNAVGFYFESPDVGAFLWALAREHKGNFVGLR